MPFNVKSCGYKFCFMTRNMQITCKVVTMHKFRKHDIKWTKVAKYIFQEQNEKKCWLSIQDVSNEYAETISNLNGS